VSPKASNSRGAFDMAALLRQGVPLDYIAAAFGRLS